MGASDLNPASFDRTDFCPPHEGPNVIPHDIIFHRLLHLAGHQNTVAVKEPHKNYEIGYHQLLSDVINERNYIRENLSEITIQKLRRGEEVCILIVARGYAFVVAFFAILALGAIAVPQSPHVSAEELTHAAKTSHAHVVISADGHWELVKSIAQRPGIDPEYRVIALDRCINTSLLDLNTLVISSNKTFDHNKPGLVIFTSGSTGPPKGVALRRYHIYALAEAQRWKTNIGPGFCVLQTLPTHHATGLLLNTIPTVVGGGTVEFTAPSLDAGALWERIRKGGITSLSAVPTVFIRLVQHWESVLAKLPSVEGDAYRKALCDIEQYHCGSAALPVSTAKKWRDLCGGRNILERYGGTEFGNPFAMLKGMPYVPGSVGVKTPGVESHLEHGNTGEVFVRSPWMFSKYIYDIEGTKKSLTKDGFFQTGDIVDKDGEFYFVKGRKSVDIIKSGGYKISALDIEREILSHPKVQEAMVVGIEDDVLGQRIAAAVVLKESRDFLSLEELRLHLQNRLSYYKLPHLLRIVPELKKNSSLKVPKLAFKRELFDGSHLNIQTMKPRNSKL